MMLISIFIILQILVSVMDKTDTERWDFVEAVYKYGTSDIDKLQSVLPNWTKTQINANITRYRFRAKKVR